MVRLVTYNGMYRRSNVQTNMVSMRWLWVRTSGAWDAEDQDLLYLVIAHVCTNIRIRFIF